MSLLKNPEQLRREKEIVQDLWPRIDKSKFFHRQAAPKLTEVLQGFAAAYGAPPSRDFLNNVPDGLAYRLKMQLENCFKNDRSFWRSPDQHVLALPSAHEGLKLDKLSSVITSGPERFWFHQIVHYGVKQTYFTFSEPLFFFSQSLNAYVRFLEINHDLPSLEAKAAELGERARNTFSATLQAQGLDATPAQELVKALDFAPVRLYVPAGDAFGISWIRRWFRKHHKDLRPPSRRESRRLAPDADNTLNRIVFASRYTNPSLVYLREKCAKIRCDLTERGIHIDNEAIPDTVGLHGTTLAHVVVTNWVFDTNNSYTILASNHTRAAGRVAQLLVAEEEDPESQLDPSMLVRADKIIPPRMQLVFSVELNVNESHANEPKLRGGPFFYD